MGRNQSQTSRSRSDEVRKRRTERLQQRATQAGARASNPVNVRPVIVRGNMFGTPIHRQAGTKPRRAYYLTMDQTAGAELRLPTLPLINPGWRLLSGLIAGLAILGLFSLWNSPYFLIDTVTVLGVQRLNAEELAYELDLNNLSIVEVDPHVIKTTLAKNYPELSEIEVTVEMPNFVTVSVVERQPVLAWKNGDSVTWIDAEGTIFPVRGEAGPLLTIHSEDGVPLAPVTSEELATKPLLGAGTQETEEKENEEQQALQPAARRADPGLLEAAQSLSTKLPPETSLVYDNQNGLGWVAPEGWQVYIGASLSDFEAKFDMYQQLASYLVGQGLQPSLVSVAQINAPFYRLEQ